MSGLARQQGTSRRALLRAATATVHQEVEGEMEALAFFASRQGYAEFLQRSFGFYASFEAAGSAAGVGRLLHDWPERRRTALLERDCRTLGLPTHLRSIPELGLRITGTASLLGALYVTEGASLGSTVLAQRVGALGLDSSKGAAFLNSHRPQQWRGFLQVLEATPLEEGAEDALISAARATFGAYRNILTAARPSRSESES